MSTEKRTPEELAEELEAAELELEQQRERLEKVNAELESVRKMGELANSTLNDWKQSAKPVPAYGPFEFTKLDIVQLESAINNHMAVQRQANPGKVIIEDYCRQYREAVVKYVNVLGKIKHPKPSMTAFEAEQNQPYRLKAQAKALGQDVQTLAQKVGIKSIVKILDDSAVDSL